MNSSVGIVKDTEVTRAMGDLIRSANTAGKIVFGLWLVKRAFGVYEDIRLDRQRREEEAHQQQIEERERAIQRLIEWEESKETSLRSFVRINTRHGTTYGICLDNVLRFRVGSQRFTVPLDRVRSIGYWRKGLRIIGGRIDMTDGSRIDNPRFLPLYFCTILGVQRVSFADYNLRVRRGGASAYDHYIQGISPRSVDALRRRLEDIRRYDQEALRNIIGSDFDRYYDPRRIRQMASERPLLLTG